MDRWNNELEGLFREYRNAVQDPDPGANFMPELWRKIEARKTFTLRVKKLSHLFVAAAAALCLLFAMVSVVPNSFQEPHGNYVDALAESQPSDNLVALGIHPEAHK